MNVTLTEIAELRLRTFLTTKEKSPNSGVQIGVSEGGCNGYEYNLKLVSHPRENDLILDNGRLKVFVNPQSAPLLDGIVIDYIEGILESGFKFSNPNATETCGCGKSFQAGQCTPTGIPCS